MKPRRVAVVGFFALVATSYAVSGCVGTVVREDETWPDTPGQTTAVGATINDHVGFHGEPRALIIWISKSSRPYTQPIVMVRDPLLSLETGWRLLIPEPLASLPSDSLEAGGVILLAENRGDDSFEIGHGSRERVIGRAKDVRIAKGGQMNPAPTSDGGRPSAKYVKRKRDCSRAPDQMGGCTFSDEDLDDAQSPAIVIDIDFQDPTLQNYTCTPFWGEDPDHISGYPDDTPGYDAGAVKATIWPCGGGNPACHGLDLPPKEQPGVTVEFSLSEDGLTCHWSACVADATLCNTPFCHYGGSLLRASTTERPPEWPDNKCR